MKAHDKSIYLQWVTAAAVSVTLLKVGAIDTMITIALSGNLIQYLYVVGLYVLGVGGLMALTTLELGIRHGYDVKLYDTIHGFKRPDLSWTKPQPFSLMMPMTTITTTEHRPTSASGTYQSCSNSKEGDSDGDSDSDGDHVENSDRNGPAPTPVKVGWDELLRVILDLKREFYAIKNGEARP